MQKQRGRSRLRPEQRERRASQQFQSEEHVSGLAGIQGEEEMQLSEEELGSSPEPPQDYIPSAASLPGHTRATSLTQLAEINRKLKEKKLKRKKMDDDQERFREELQRLRRRRPNSPAETEQMKKEAEALSIQRAQEGGVAQEFVQKTRAALHKEAVALKGEHRMGLRDTKELEKHREKTQVPLDYKQKMQAADEARRQRYQSPPVQAPVILKPAIKRPRADPVTEDQPESTAKRRKLPAVVDLTAESPEREEQKREIYQKKTPVIKKPRIPVRETIDLTAETPARPGETRKTRPKPKPILKNASIPARNSEFMKRSIGRQLEITVAMPPSVPEPQITEAAFQQAKEKFKNRLARAKNPLLFSSKLNVLGCGSNGVILTTRRTDPSVFRMLVSLGIPLTPRKLFATGFKLSSFANCISE